MHIHSCDAVHRVAQLPTPGTLGDLEYMRLVLWVSTKPTTGMNAATLRRAPIGELTLTLSELAPLAQKGPYPYVRRLQSEKFPGAEVRPLLMAKLR
jgi:hypothetical protein